MPKFVVHAPAWKVDRVEVGGNYVETFYCNHDELMERRGVYYAMFMQQFERHRDPAMERIEWELESKA